MAPKGKARAAAAPAAAEQPAKRQKVSKELAVTAIGDGGGDLVKAERNDDRWDRKFEGQKFGEWSAEEIEWADGEPGEP